MQPRLIRDDIKGRPKRKKATGAPGNEDTPTKPPAAKAKAKAKGKAKAKQCS